MVEGSIVPEAGAADGGDDNNESRGIDQGEKKERRVLASSDGENDGGVLLCN